jgi:hypothetical protein
LKFFDTITGAVYEQVWTSPTTQVAQSYGFSDVMLTKIRDATYQNLHSASRLDQTEKNDQSFSWSLDELSSSWRQFRTSETSHAGCSCGVSSGDKDQRGSGHGSNR